MNPRSVSWILWLVGTLAMGSYLVMLAAPIWVMLPGAVLCGMVMPLDDQVGPHRFGNRRAQGGSR